MKTRMIWMIEDAVYTLKFISGLLKKYRKLIMTALIILLFVLMAIPWMDMFHELNELVIEDEVLSKLVKFVVYSMGMMLLPILLFFSRR